jgi:hypothetical protein
MRWEDRAGYKGRHQFMCALWCLIDDSPDVLDKDGLLHHKPEVRERFQKLISVLSDRLQSIPLTDLAAQIVRDVEKTGFSHSKKDFTVEVLRLVKESKTS